MKHLILMFEETSYDFFLGWLSAPSCATTVGDDLDEAAMYMMGGEL